MSAVDKPKLHRIEEVAREIGKLIGGAVNSTDEHFGFALFVFSFEGPELTWISNANREDMIKALEEFIEKAKAGTWDELSRPKGRG